MCWEETYFERLNVLKTFVHVADKKTNKSKAEEKKKSATTADKQEEQKVATPVSSFFGENSNLVMYLMSYC